MKLFPVLAVFLMALVLGSAMHFNESLTKNHAKKQFGKKIRKDYRKLKKQEGAIKLVGSERGDFEGNVEILHNGKWGNICDDEWDYLEANVVCRQLGFDGAIKPTTNGYFGQAKRRFWMDNIYCDGTELELSRCRFDGWGASDCESSEAAGVICKTDHRHNYYNKKLLHRKENRIKLKVRDVYHEDGIEIRLAGGRTPDEGRVEVHLESGNWSVICGDGWSILEASVICKQLGLGYASHAIQTNFFGGQKLPMFISGVQCNGNEETLIDCALDKSFKCPGEGKNIAGVICTREIADLIFDHIELMRTAHLEDRLLYWLQCAMEENCVASQAYRIQRESDNWHLETRRLLRFTARILNIGTADFRPSVPKHLWEWHMCHMHYHSMEVFATFDIIDVNGNKVAEGHKASFCLEDNQCLPGVEPKYKCANYGDQGISVNCSDIYKHNIDCQWIDVSELEPGEYTLKVAVNPEFKVGEMSFANNAANCKLLYTESFAKVHSCKIARP